MVLYHGINKINTLKPIIHHMVYHPNEKCILVGSFNENYKKFDNIEHTISYKGFNNGPFGNGVTLNGKELYEYTINYFDNEFNKININLDDISEFYIGSCWGNFDKYLQFKNKKYHFLEEAPGSLGGSDGANILKKYVLLSQIEQNIIDKSSFVNYDVTEEIFKLNDEQRKQIIKFFNVPTEPIKKFDILLLTQWWFENTNNNKIYTNDDRIYMYGLLLDYYCNNKSVYIKPHPSDNIKSNYLNYFTNCDVEIVNYISELMGLIPNIHFEKAITISSSSLITVSSFCDELIEIGHHYRELHYKIIKYDVAVELSKFLYGFNLNVVRYGIYERNLSVFPIFFVDIPERDCSVNDQIVISDEFYLKNPHRLGKFRIEENLEPDQLDMQKNGSIRKFVEATENTNNCFIITHNFEEIYDKVIRDINNIIVIKISKEKVKEICGADLQNEYIYVYCKNIDIRNKVEEFVFKKHLFQTGINITAKPMSLEETQMHYETVALASKQVELKNEVKNLTNSLNESKKIGEQTKLELNKVNEKFNSLEKIVNKLNATDNKTKVYETSRKVDNIDNIDNIVKQLNTTVANKTDVNEIFQKVDNIEMKMTEVIPIEKKLQSIENNINKKFDVILRNKTNEYYKVNGQLKWARGEINNIKNSFSYKLGRVLTWLPRKVICLFKK